MSIKHAILGFLSWEPLTGYDLKKRFMESTTLYWTGNNNQIYRSLVDLHQDGLVTKEVRQQEKLPARKIYSITADGRKALREWVLQPPELPQLKNSFLVQLSWADQLADSELEHLVESYQEEVQVKLLMLQEQFARGNNAPDRSARERLLWRRISSNMISYYQNELNWVQELGQELEAL